MSEKDKANIEGVLDAIGKIQGYVEGIASPAEYYQSNVVFDATLMNFIVIGESVDRLSDETKGKHPAIDWKRIKDFRNLIAHDYLGIDAEEVWQIILNDLPKLKSDLQKISDTL
jgi:uncharacterized protein with HEPN domain